MNPLNRRFSSGLILASCIWASISVEAEELAGKECPLGAYRSASGGLLAITRLPPKSPGGCRYTMLNGKRGYSSEPDSPIICRSGRLFSRGSGEAWTKLALRETPTYFESNGVRLYGVLLEPPAAVIDPPLVILTHGSEQTSPIGLFNQELLAAQGVSVFAYDKRGTGKSGGEYTQDFIALADDAVNAAKEACTIAAGRYRRFGFEGGSQGGWVATLAALKASADFVVVGYGVAGTPLEQDQWQVDYQLKQRGFGRGILPEIHAVTAATAAVAGSGFTSHLEELDTVRSKYSGEKWFAMIEGQYSGELLRGQVDLARSESPQVPWHYSGLEALRRLRIPQVWILAQDDSVAPAAPTLERLKALQREGCDLRLFVFPGTDHGIRKYTLNPDGSRTMGDPADGYLKLLADAMKGAVSTQYGTSFEDGSAKR